MQQSDTHAAPNTPEQPNPPKQSVDTDKVDPAEQPNPGDPGPAVLRPDEHSALPGRPERGS